MLQSDFRTSYLKCEKRAMVVRYRKRKFAPHIFSAVQGKRQIRFRTSHLKCGNRGDDKIDFAPQILSVSAEPWQATK